MTAEDMQAQADMGIRITRTLDDLANELYGNPTLGDPAAGGAPWRPYYAWPGLNQCKEVLRQVLDDLQGGTTVAFTEVVNWAAYSYAAWVSEGKIHLRVTHYSPDMEGKEPYIRLAHRVELIANL